jgi:alpha-L-fucosidase
METTAFLHFTVNTFTNKEWGYGDEDPNIFQPAAFDPDAIISALADAGMRGVILTCKHHDGFCLWPTATTAHSIRASSWRAGQGDIVRDISQAARRRSLAFGVYLSPWDRNNPAYGTPAYLPIYRRQLTELLTGYGPIFEVWHDGANGGDGFYGGAREKRTIDKNTYYDWPATWDLVRTLQPQAVIFSDVGPDVRWVGNERGIAGDPCWATYDPVGADGGPASPGNVREKDSPTGTPHGARWLPAECDVSIRPGWFWHEAENSRVKSAAQLVDLYYQSVGRGANLLLNVPPNRDGLLSSPDVAALQGFGQYRRRTFARNVLGKFNPRTFECPCHAPFNVIRLQEDIRYGQRIERAAIDRWDGRAWSLLAEVTTIGARRLVRLQEKVQTPRLRLRLTAPTPPLIAAFSAYAE